MSDLFDNQRFYVLSGCHDSSADAIIVVPPTGSHGLGLTRQQNIAISTIHVFAPSARVKCLLINNVPEAWSRLQSNNNNQVRQILSALSIPEQPVKPGLGDRASRSYMEDLLRWYSRTPYVFCRSFAKTDDTKTDSGEAEDTKDKLTEGADTEGSDTEGVDTSESAIQIVVFGHSRDFKSRPCKFEEHSSILKGKRTAGMLQSEAKAKASLIGEEIRTATNDEVFVVPTSSETFWSKYGPKNNSGSDHPITQLSDNADDRSSFRQLLVLHKDNITPLPARVGTTSSTRT